MSDSSFSKGFLVGALIGAGLVFFLGTERGRKLKEKLLEQGEDVLEQAQKWLEASESKEEPPSQLPIEEPLPGVQVESFAHLQNLQEQGRGFGRRFFHRRPKTA